MLTSIIGGFIGMALAILAAVVFLAILMRLTDLRRQIETLFKLWGDADEKIKQLEANAIAFAPPEISKIVH